ncbi:MAG: DUF4412 domain-containing protein [Acidobacteriota bacterium]|nr:DUF4412 domain-containing protein [Acidobacteriota bacterium]
MNFINKKVFLSLSLTSLVGCFGLACQQPVANGNQMNATANITSPPRNTNSVTGANSFNDSSTNSAINTKEPEQYQATVMLKLETAGAQNMSLPPLKAEVARKNNDRRMEFKLPTGETIVFLDKGGRQLLIQPDKKQYAELDKEAVGFEVRRFLMPEQIVNQLKAMKGVEQVGEEKIDGRDAIKYRFASSTNTQSQAGKVDTESIILVDKETGLPLRSFTNSASQGNVQGINGLNLITELNNIRTDVDANLFNEPTDYKKVAPEEIRAQIDILFKAATAIIGQVMKSAQPATQSSPTATTTP